MNSQAVDAPMAGSQSLLGAATQAPNPERLSESGTTQGTHPLRRLQKLFKCCCVMINHLIIQFDLAKMVIGKAYMESTHSILAPEKH